MKFKQLEELVYWGRSYLDKAQPLDAQKMLQDWNRRLDHHEAFYAGKIGGNELWALRTIEFQYDDKIENLYQYLSEGAGYFYDGDLREGVRRYVKQLLSALQDIDYLSEWDKKKEYYFARKYTKDTCVRVPFITYKIAGQYPLGVILKNRKVLVVSPFEKSVRMQYERREKLFDDPEMLPEFDLLTVQAVQTIAGNRDPRFKTWIEALDYMTNEIAKLDFDIALVGCGAYSLPLCKRIKDMNKSAIHLGGSVQTLFGIRGKRWDHYGIYNQYWKNPEPEEIPRNSYKVEEGAYW